MNSFLPPILSSVLLWAALSVNAAEDRDAKVQNDRKEVSNMAGWVYNDLPKAIEQAHNQRKPMLVVFRCVT